jgi:capsular polysaccharide biosynthesis protein
MELNEAFRRIVVGHLRLLVPFVLLPVLGIGWLAMTARTEYAASARIQASSATIGSDTEADSVLNRVRGVATSTAILAKALDTAHVADRSVADISSEVTVSRLGSSPLLDITVTDSSAAVAHDVSDGLANSVVDFLTVDGSQQAQRLVKQLTDQQQELTFQRQMLAGQLSATNEATARETLSSRLSTVDQQLNDMGSTLRELQVTIATDSSASLVSSASTAKATHSTLPVKAVLAVIAGLLAGLLVASLLEVAVPRVFNSSSFARETGVPVLGRIAAVAPNGSPQEGDARARYQLSPESVVALRHAAARADAQTIVLVGEPDAIRAAELARTITGQLATRSAVQATSNGHAGQARSAAAVSSDPAKATTSMVAKTATKTATKSAARTQPRSTASRRAIEQEPPVVIQLSDLAERNLSRDAAILVIVADRAPYRDFQGIQDLASATGWPIIGVLGQPIRRRRGSAP